MVKAWLWLAVIATLLAAAPGEAWSLKVDFGGGLSMPFDEDVRDQFGVSLSVAGGVAAQFPNNRGEVFVETGYTGGSAPDLTDPTFELADSSYRIVPFTFGFRPNLAPTATNLQLLLELAFQTVLVHYDDLGQRSDTSTAPGFLIGLRAEFQAADTWSVWVRQRLSAQAQARFFREFEQNFSSWDLHVGVAWVGSR